MRKLILILSFSTIVSASFSQSSELSLFADEIKQHYVYEGWSVLYEGHQDINSEWGHGTGEYDFKSYKDYGVILIVENSPNYKPYIVSRNDFWNKEYAEENEISGDLVFKWAVVTRKGGEAGVGWVGQYVGRIASDEYVSSYLLLITRDSE